MIRLNQNDKEHLQDLLQRGEITADRANVEMVRMQRVRVVRSSLPANERKVLNKAVRNGELHHMKKSGMKPEVYYHPSFEYLANEERNRIEVEALKAIARVCI